MTESFNPYVEWLGFPSGRRPANHYELLGVALYESDLNVIAQAADALVSRIRRVRPGQHVVEWQQLLDELRMVKASLTAPAAKSVYDADLRQRTQPGTAAPASAPQGPQLATPPGLGAKQPAQPTPSPAASPTNLAAQSLRQAPVLPQTPVTPPSAIPTQDQAPLASPVPPTQPLAVPFATPAAPMAQGPALGQPPPNAFTSAGLPAVPSASIPAATPYPGGPSAEPAPSAIPMAVPVADPAVDLPPAVSIRREVYRPRTKSSAGLLVAQVVLIGLILAGAGFAFVLYQEKQQDAATAKTASVNKASTVPPAPAKDPVPQRRPKTSPRPKPIVEPKQPKPTENETPSAVPTPEPKPEQPMPKHPMPEPKPEAKPPVVEPQPAPKAETPLDPQKQRALSQALTDVRASLAESDLQAAQKFLATATKYVQSSDDKVQVERLKSLTSNLEEFWKTMRQIVGGLKATDEIPFRDDMIIVVEVGPDILTIKVAGQIREYTPLTDMPYLLVTTLADRRFGKDPQSKAIYASYLAVAPKGDRQRARQLWQEAIAEGVDVSYLLPELDQTWPGAVTTSSSQKSSPPNDKDALKRTEEAIRMRFRAEYEQATSPADKAQLAKKLLRAGQAAAENDPNDCFIMLREARDLAIAAGDPGLVCTTIGELARSHAIDALAMKTVALEEVVKEIRGASNCKELVQNVLPLIEEAISSDRPAEASRLANAATLAAQKSKSPALVKQVRAATQELALPSQERKAR